MSEPEQTPMERAAAYKRDRKARGLSQTELAKAVGVRQATISDREAGKHEFGQEAVMALRSLPIPLAQKAQAEPILCGWDSASGKCPMAATWECLLYEGHEDEAWTPFCQHHYGLAKFHGWKIRLLNGHGDGGTA